MSKKQGRRVRLKKTFLESFDWNQPGISRHKFVRWAKEARPDYVGVSEHNYTSMRKGGAVPADIIAAFTEYLSEHLQISVYRQSTISEEVPSDRLGLWGMGWKHTHDWVKRQFRLPEAAYVSDREDLTLAALIVAESVGLHHNPQLGKDAAIALGEQVMCRSVGEYAAQLEQFWNINHYSVLFPSITRVRQQTVRVGVSVVVPLTHDAYLRFRAGEMEDLDLTAQEIAAVPSRYLLMDAVNESRPHGGLSDKNRQRAQMNTLLYQFAALCPPMFNDAVQPSIITFAGTPEQRRRLNAYDYGPVGTHTPRTHLDIFEYPSHPSSANPAYRLLAASNWYVMKAVISFCQSVIYDDHSRREAAASDSRSS